MGLSEAGCGSQELVGIVRRWVCGVLTPVRPGLEPREPLAALCYLRLWMHVKSGISRHKQREPL